MPAQNNRLRPSLNTRLLQQEDNMHEHLRKTAIASVAALSLAAVAMSSPALAFGGGTWHGGHGGWHGGWHGGRVGAEHGGRVRAEDR